jgi:hypothetical protein
VYHSRIEISPSRKWAVTAIAAGLLWWSFVVTISIFGWLGADWILKAVTGLFLLGTVAMTILVAARWRSLSLIADSRTVRFGVRVLARNDLAAIRIGPVARTRGEFWVGVVAMAIAQDLSRKVDFLAGDGRVLLEVPDLYGRAQLIKLASFLSVPFDGSLK